MLHENFYKSMKKLPNHLVNKIGPWKLVRLSSEGIALFIILACAAFGSSESLGQQALSIPGKIQLQEWNSKKLTLEDTKDGLKDANLLVYQDDVPFDAVQTDSRGEFVLNLPLGHRYLLILEESGFCNKKIEVDVSNVQSTTVNIPVLSMGVFELPAGFNQGIFDEPAGEVSWVDNGGFVTTKPEEISRLNNRVNAEYQRVYSLEEQFQDLMDEGESAMKDDEWRVAINLFESALELKPGDAEALALRAESEEELNRDYAKLVTRGDEQYEEKDWEDAIDAYDRALNLKPNEEYPIDRKKLVAQEMDYEERLESAEDLLDDDLVDAARREFSAAGKIFPDRNEWKDGIARCDNLPSEDPPPSTESKKSNKDEAMKTEKPQDVLSDEPPASANDEKAHDDPIRKEYDAVVRTADQLLGKRDFDAAIEQYEKALELLPEEEYPRRKISQAEAQRNANDVQGEYDAVIAKGDDAFHAKNWSEARRYYEQALTIKPGDGHATSGIKMVERWEAMGTVSTSTPSGGLTQEYIDQLRAQLQFEIEQANDEWERMERQRMDRFLADEEARIAREKQEKEQQEDWNRQRADAVRKAESMNAKDDVQEYYEGSFETYVNQMLEEQRRVATAQKETMDSSRRKADAVANERMQELDETIQDGKTRSNNWKNWVQGEIQQRQRAEDQRIAMNSRALNRIQAYAENELNNLDPSKSLQNQIALEIQYFVEQELKQAEIFSESSSQYGQLVQRQVEFQMQQDQIQADQEAIQTNYRNDQLRLQIEEELIARNRASFESERWSNGKNPALEEMVQEELSNQSLLDSKNTSFNSQSERTIVQGEPESITISNGAITKWTLSINGTSVIYTKVVTTFGTSYFLNDRAITEKTWFIDRCLYGFDGCE